MKAIGRVLREILVVLEEIGPARNSEMRMCLSQHTSTGMCKYLGRCVMRGFVVCERINRRDKLYTVAPDWRRLVAAYGRGHEPAVPLMAHQFAGRKFKRSIPTFGAHNPWGTNV